MVIKKGLLSTEIANEIEALIHNQKLQVGNQLPNEIALSEQLGVSRTTIREAVKTLSAKGVVEIKRGIGTFVCKMPGLVSDSLGLTFADQSNIVEELYQFRMMIEPDIAAMAAKNASDEDLFEVEEAYAKFITDYHEYSAHKIGIEEASKRYIDNEIHFHTSIAKCTGNGVIERVIFGVMESYAQIYWKDNFIPDNLIYNDQHKDILDALMNKDSAMAREKMINHLDYAKSYFLEREALNGSAKFDHESQTQA